MLYKPHFSLSLSLSTLTTSTYMYMQTDTSIFLLLHRPEKTTQVFASNIRNSWCEWPRSAHARTWALRTCTDGAAAAQAQAEWPTLPTHWYSCRTISQQLYDVGLDASYKFTSLIRHGVHRPEQHLDGVRVLPVNVLACLTREVYIDQSNISTGFASCL